MTTEKKTCFILTANESEGTEAKRRIQQIVRHVIGPARYSADTRSTCPITFRKLARSVLS